MTYEVEQLIVEQKMAFAILVSDICMTWWVSSVVFCASIFGAVWIRRKDFVGKEGLLRSLGIILSIFFMSIWFFGLLIAFYYVRNVDAQLKTLLVEMGRGADLFATEMNTIFWGVLIGTSSFFLIWVAWFALWGKLAAGKWIDQLPHEVGSINCHTKWPE